MHCQDGVVDTDEFKQLMESKFGNSMDVQAAFSKFDVNNDGVLDKDEMVAVQMEIEQRAAQAAAGAGQGQGVRSEVLEAQLERIETFVVAVHGSCSALHDNMEQASECNWQRAMMMPCCAVSMMVFRLFAFQRPKPVLVRDISE
jgi:hypothetical protein